MAKSKSTGKKSTKESKLTPKEDVIFSFLQDNIGDDVSRLALRQVLGIEGIMESNLIDVHIKNLRKKLPEGMTISPVRGFGYRLTTV